MDLQKFEEIEERIVEIVKRVGTVKPEWVAKELNIPETDACEVLEALRHRGDLAKDSLGTSYHKRTHF